MSDTTHFGFKEIPVETKQGRVNDVFRSVANRYDLMNDIMSFGLHRAWKNMFVARLRVPLNRPFLCLDIAGGTGDIAFRILRDGGEQTRVTILDINPAMLEEGRRRAPEEFLGRLQFIQGNAEHLPFADDTFDACTIAFGIRNVPRIDGALAEARRVLKPGGHFLCLEFSTVDVPLLDRLYEFYSLKVIPQIGGMVTGDSDAYTYLVESIRRFPNAETFESMLQQAGFSKTSHELYSSGIVAVHSGWKI